MPQLAHVDWTDVLEHLETLATSEVTREDIRDLSALSSPEAAMASFDQIGECLQLIAGGRRPSMDSLDLFSTWFERLKKEAVLKPLELKDVRHFCLDVAGLQDGLKPFSTPWLEGRRKQLMDPKGPISAIDQIMTASGEIRTDASETLYILHREKQDKERKLQSELNQLVKKNEMGNVLQDRFVTNRQGRWVVPVKSGMQKDLEGVVHDKSHSKQTVFLEPQQVMVLNNEIFRLEADIEKEIERLLTELSKFLHRLVGSFEASRAVLMEMDSRLAHAQRAQQLRATRPSFSVDRIRLRSVRHPIMALGSEKVVANDTELHSAQRILLLSGPNAGGKTVLLKSIGLAAQMARCGMWICADDGSSLPFFRGIHVAVGDDQSVQSSLSTFAAHLKSLTEATQVKGTEHLLLIDEICGATDPEEGAALARSFIEHFSANQVFGIVTSHLGPLKENWPQGQGVINGRLDYDEVHGRPTYRLFLGLPGQSLAIKTAQRIGVPESVVRRALELINPETRNRHQKLDELEKTKAEMEQLQEILRREKASAEEAKTKYGELISTFKRERETWMNRAVEKAEKKIEDLLEKAREAAANSKALNDIKAQLPQIIKSPVRTSIQSPEDFEKAFPPGSPVWVTSLNQEGLVQSAPDAKGRVTVLAQSIRLQLLWSELEPPRRSASRPTSTAGAALGGSGPRHERQVDIRGQRVDDALREVESQLDVAIRNGEDRLKILHGHGTEALKKAIRSYLSRSPYVRKWKAGDTHSGGDGVTWVELTD